MVTSSIPFCNDLFGDNRSCAFRCAASVAHFFVTGGGVAVGLRFRKSVKLCKGVRVNFSKSGVGLSVGTKGCRYSLHSSGRSTASIGIPGTGLYYSHSSGGSKRKKKSSSTSSKRKYRSTAYVNRQLIQQQKQMAKQEQKRKDALLVAEYENYLDVIRGVHKECEPTVDWQSISQTPPPFLAGEKGPKQIAAENKYDGFKLNLLEKIIHSDGAKRRKKLFDAIAPAIEENRRTYDNWEAMHLFAKSIVDKNIDSMLTAIEEANPFDDLLEYGSDFEFGTDDPDCMTTEFRVKGTEVIPAISMSLTKTGVLSKKPLSKTQFFDYLQDYVCSCAIRVARELFAVIPVDTVIVHATERMINKVSGMDEDCTILSVRFKRDFFAGINFDRIDPSDFIEANEHNMRFAKTTGFKPVERLV